VPSHSHHKHAETERKAFRALYFVTSSTADIYCSNSV